MPAVFCNLPPFCAFVTLSERGIDVISLFTNFVCTGLIINFPGKKRLDQIERGTLERKDEHYDWFGRLRWRGTVKA